MLRKKQRKAKGVVLAKCVTAADLGQVQRPVRY